MADDLHRASGSFSEPVRWRPGRGRPSVLALFFAVLVASCDSPTAPHSDPATVEVSPSSLTFDDVGEAASLSARVLDDAGRWIRGRGVKWSSSDPTVMEVTEEGEVRAVGLGRARITATVGSASGSATARAEPEPRSRLGDFSIELHYLSEMGPELRMVFERAAARWEEIITGNLPEVPVRLEEGGCGEGSPALQREVNDILVLVLTDSIDGPGGTLASAGPCVVREIGGLPVVGRVRIDVEDLDRLNSIGFLEDVVLHEMSHALGFGALWISSGYLRNPSLPDNQGADTHFRGPSAVEAFDGVGGAHHDVSRVPVENVRGAEGTRDTHWRSSVFRHELMTGFVSEGQNPLSRVTVASLMDLGYEVDFDAADSYTLMAPAAAAGEPSPWREQEVHLGDDLYRGPVRIVDARGHTVKIVPELPALEGLRSPGES